MVSYYLLPDMAASLILINRLLIVLCSLAGGGYVISVSTTFWFEDPTVIEVGNLHYKLNVHRDVPFPSVTICPSQERDMYNLPGILLNR